MIESDIRSEPEETGGAERSIRASSAARSIRAAMLPREEDAPARPCDGPRARRGGMMKWTAPLRRSSRDNWGAGEKQADRTSPILIDIDRRHASGSAIWTGPGDLRSSAATVLLDSGGRNVHRPGEAAIAGAGSALRSSLRDRLSPPPISPEGVVVTMLADGRARGSVGPARLLTGSPAKRPKQAASSKPSRASLGRAAEDASLRERNAAASPRRRPQSLRAGSQRRGSV